MLTIPQHGFYVYTLSTPDGSVFYVGKGCGNRIDVHEREAKRNCQCHKCKKIRKLWKNGYQVVKAIVFTTDDEQEALDYEEQLIKHFGLPALTNKVEGGTLRTRYSLPDKPITEITDQEYITFLRSVYPSITTRQINKDLKTWWQRKLHVLETNRKTMTMFGRRPDTTEIDQAIEHLYILLDLVYQHRLIVTDDNRLCVV